MKDDINKKIGHISLDDIYDFVDNGNPDDADEAIVTYLDLMDKVRSMHLRVAQFGTRESIVKHLMKVEKLTRHLAVKLYYNALEYFYASSELSKQAQRNVYADKLDRMIVIAELAVKDVKDANMLAGMIEKAAKIRGLDKEDVDFVPEDWFKEQVVVYTTDALKAGLDPINRNQLAKDIEKYPEIPEKVKMMIKREALLEPLTLFEDEQENARKN